MSALGRIFTAGWLVLAAGLAASGCSRGPKPIRYGQDECAHCKMTLVDQHYGAEHVTARGRVFLFDDLNCLTAHLRRASQPEDPAAQSLVIDFNRPNRLLPVGQALFLQHPGLRTPMASSLGAFSSEAELETVRRQLGGGGRVLRWAEVNALPP